MSYNRAGTSKFWIDAVLLARQWGQIEYENDLGKYYLNPSNVSSVSPLTETGLFDLNIVFKNRYWRNSLSHIFILGHNFYSDSINYRLKGFFDSRPTDTNGWLYYSYNELNEYSSLNGVTLELDFSGGDAESTPLGDISLGWSFEMPHSSDLELTQSFGNESVKTQTTLGGHTLTNAGWNQKSGWIKPSWARGTSSSSAYNNKNFKVFPSGRRQWSLKFSYLSDTDLFPSDLNSDYGIFQKTGDESDNDSDFTIKSDWLSKVWFGTNCGQNPFVFQPNKDEENEFAICRFDTNTMTFNQVANNVYDISLTIVEVW